MLSAIAMQTLEKISAGKVSCSELNRQIIDKLRREGFVRVTIRRSPGQVPLRFCQITPEGLKYLSQQEKDL